jgi:membrane protein implicated in regulation of membrane protease activity
MMHRMLLLAHLIGALMLGAAIVGCILTDARARGAPTIARFADALQTEDLFQQRLLLPGVILLLASGVALVAAVDGGWGLLGAPWLAAMVLLFVIEGLRANTTSRRHAVRLRQLAAQAGIQGRITPELDRARGDRRAVFARFLELAAFLLMLLLGVLRLQSWLAIGACAAAGVLAATLATYVVSPGVSAPSRLSRASVDGDGRA